VALYRLYHLRDDRIVSREDIEAETDAEAKALAAANASGGAVELWKGSRKVAALPAAAPPAGEAT